MADDFRSYRLITVVASVSQFSSLLSQDCCGDMQRLPTTTSPKLPLWSLLQAVMMVVVLGG